MTSPEENAFGIPTDAGGSLVEITPEELAAHTIVVAEDDDAVRHVFVESIQRKFGCAIVDVPNGDEAMAYIRDNRVDVLVTDMNMPGISGLDIIHAAKESDPGIAVIVVTGFVDRFPFLDVLDAGATDFIQKPGSPEEFQAKVYRVLREGIFRERLMKTESKYRAMFEMSVASNILLDSHNLEMREMNNAFLNLVKGANEDLVNRSFLDIVRPGEHDRVKTLFELLRSRGGGTMGDIGLVFDHDHELIADAAISYIDVPGESLILMNLIDITERRNVEQQLASAAVTDQLTGLANRRAFNTQLQGAIIRTARNDETLALMLIDLDNFKQCNDTHGHQVGDEVLEIVADVVRTNIRDGRGDQGYRLGGDEFAVILGATDKAGAFVVANRMRETFEDRETYGTTLSVGIAEYIPGSDSEAFVKSADEVLYEAKGQGKNTVCVAGA